MTNFDQTITYDYGDGGGEVDEMAGLVSSIGDGITTVAQYGRFGVGGVDAVTLPEPDVTSTVAAFTSRTDRFWKPTANRWRRNPASVDFVSIDLQYDQAGNMVILEDNVLRNENSDRVFDVSAAYDDLRRVTEWVDGKTVALGGTPAREELWTRNILGQTTNTKLNLNALLDSDYSDTGEWDDDRTYGKRSNLLTRDTNSSSPAEFTLTYDKNGNLTSDGENFSYVYNPWCQLVYVKNLAGSVTIAAYTYNGLGMRISEQTDTNDGFGTGFPDGVVDGDDSVFYIVNDLQGRRLGTYRGLETDAKETFTWHPTDAVGPAFKGGPILRDRNADLIDPEEWDKGTAESSRGDRLYYCSNYKGDVVALLAPDGSLQEQVRYSATGVPFGIPLGDVSADGVVDGYSGKTDYDIIDNLINLPGYEVRADLDLDGDVDSNDLAICAGMDGEALGRGSLSIAGVRNNLGYYFGEHHFGLQVTGQIWGPALGIAVTVCSPDDNWDRKPAQSLCRAGPRADSGDVSELIPGVAPSLRAPFPRFPNQGACARWVQQLLSERDAHLLDPCVQRGVDSGIRCCMNGDSESECTTMAINAIWNCRNRGVSSECTARCFQENFARCAQVCIGCGIAVGTNAYWGCETICAEHLRIPSLYWPCVRVCWWGKAFAIAATCPACLTCTVFTWGICADECSRGLRLRPTH